MKISIDVPMLIAKAKHESGLTYGEMAEEMHRSRTRISEWLASKADPTSDDIAYLAEKARLPIIETVAALRPEWAHVWKKAVREIRQNQGLSRWHLIKIKERLRALFIGAATARGLAGFRRPLGALAG